MLQQVIDRRAAGKNKSIGNRERFLRRHQGQIREAVRRAVQGRSIRDLERGEDVHIPRKDLSEPVFGHGSGGVQDWVHTGNQQHITGDRIPRPKGGQGSGGQGSNASDSGEGEDDFIFSLTKEEFMQIFFEDLALPHLVRNQFADITEFKTHRAGFTSDGTPNNLHVVRSMRGALGRRIALGSASRKELKALEERVAEMRRHPFADPAIEEECRELEARISVLKARLGLIPFLDPIDLKFRNRVKTPLPTAKAVMFCLMDVSGSMDEERKELAKRFYILLYLFLTRHYEKIDLVFIRHHTQAKEVNEHDFFHNRESGGTVVSSALSLMADIIRERYNPNEWNIYGAQASDGDNWESDDAECQRLLSETILPACRFYAYVQVVDEPKNLWYAYEEVAAKHRQFALRRVSEAGEIYPVFRDLFKREGATT